MAAPSETYIDPAEGASNGNDHGGAAFVDGSFANATNTLTKTGAFPAATCQAGDKLYLDDNGSGEVSAGLYTISSRTDDDNVVLASDIRSGVPDPTDVRCDQHDGTVSLPWATVKHALDFTTRDAANGDRFNVKAGTDDVLAAALDFSTYGTPTTAAPWICQGYTSAAGDGGIGGISGNGSYSMVASSALDFLKFIDMHLHNSGATNLLNLDNSIVLINCELDNTTASVQVDSSCVVLYCYFHNIGANGLQCEYNGYIAFNTFENGTNDFTIAINCSRNNTVIIGNVISIDGSSDGININANGYDNVVMGNSIWSNAGTGQGIVDGGKATALFNNIVEGFSGVGGIGYDINDDLVLYGHNSAFNNTSNFDTGSVGIYRNLGNNTTLTASAFLDAANGDFRVNSSVKAGGWPTVFKGLASTLQYLDEGAVQRYAADGPTLRGRNTLLRR